MTKEKEIKDCEFYKPRIRDKYGYGRCEIKNLQGDFHNICQHPENNNCYYKLLLKSRQEVAFFKKIYTETYDELYKIKDSQLKNPVNDMDAEDLDIKEVIKLIKESFDINDKTIDNLQQSLKVANKMVELLIRYSLYGRTYSTSQDYKADFDYEYKRYEQQALTEIALSEQTANANKEGEQ